MKEMLRVINGRRLSLKPSWGLGRRRMLISWDIKVSLRYAIRFQRLFKGVAMRLRTRFSHKPTRARPPPVLLPKAGCIPLLGSLVLVEFRAISPSLPFIVPVHRHNPFRSDMTQEMLK